MNSLGETIPPRRVLPAQQSLKADDPAVADILLRLVDEPQLFAGDRVAQVVLQETAIANGGAHRGFEEPIGSASLVLGAVECGIGVREQRLPIGRVIRAQVAIPMLVEIGASASVALARCLQDLAGCFRRCGRPPPGLKDRAQ